MSRKPSGGDDTGALWGARVSAEVEEILRMAMVFEDCSSRQELIAPVLEDYAKRFVTEPEVQAALRSKREYKARQEGKLAHLRNAGDSDNASAESS